MTAHRSPPPPSPSPTSALPSSNGAQVGGTAGLGVGASADDARLQLDDFRLLRTLIDDHCGIDLTPDQRGSVERRLRERLHILGAASFHDYVQRIRTDRSELDEAVDALTTNETYFFREEYQLRAFRDEVVPMLARQAASRRRLAVWSAGCSTGEEVYTLATLLLDAPELAGWELRVFGTDISKRCLAHARRATYGPSAFRVTPHELKKRWFIERPEGMVVQDRVRQLCHFGHLNLLEADRATAVGRIDAIFCRNVLIYLDSGARRRVIDLFHERLYPGGVLLLGHSESLLNVSTAFELLHLRADLAYRKPALQPASFGEPSSRSMRAALPITREAAREVAREESRRRAPESMSTPLPTPIAAPTAMPTPSATAAPALSTTSRKGGES